MPTIRDVSALSEPPRLAQIKSDDDPQRIAQAARQFESLLIAQLLKSMREAGSGGWLGTGDDQAGARAVELAEEQLAAALAEQGGLGLAKVVAAGLKQEGARAGRATADSGRKSGDQKLQP